MPELKYVVTIPEDRESDLSRALHEAGIEFDPVRDMVALPKEHLLDGIFTGRDLGMMRGAVNDHLQRQAAPYRLCREPDSLPAVVRMALLNCFTMHGDWTSEYSPTLRSISGEKLAELRAKYPYAFVAAP